MGSVSLGLGPDPSARQGRPTDSISQLRLRSVMTVTWTASASQARSVMTVTWTAPASQARSVLTVPPVVHTTDITKVKVFFAIHHVNVPATTTHD